MHLFSSFCLPAGLDLKPQPWKCVSPCSIMWSTALLSASSVYMDITNIPWVCLTLLWHVAEGVLWLKPDCAYPTWRSQKNRLQLRILYTRGKYKNTHMCLNSTREGGIIRGLLNCMYILFNFPFLLREFVPKSDLVVKSLRSLQAVMMNLTLTWEKRKA